MTVAFNLGDEASLSADVLLAINCQQDRSYGNRRVLRAIYGDRFPAILFVVGGSCEIDPAYPTLRTSWLPRSRDNLCACCDPRYDPHPAGRHATHPRLADVADYAAREDYAIVVFAEDDCLLSPALDPATIARRMEEVEALISYIGLCDRDSASWVWTRHATGYPEFDAVSHHLDRRRLLRNWAEFSGSVAPPILYTPMFGAFVDVLAFRTDLLVRVAPDLMLLQDVWHEAAIPSALMHRTARIGRFDGVALWNEERNRSRDELFGMLRGKDYVHPIKLSYLGFDEALAAYRSATDRGEP